MVRLMNDRIYFISFNSVIVFGSVSSKHRISTSRDHNWKGYYYIQLGWFSEGLKTAFGLNWTSRGFKKKYLIYRPKWLSHFYFLLGISFLKWLFNTVFNPFVNRLFTLSSSSNWHLAYAQLLTSSFQKFAFVVKNF